MRTEKKKYELTNETIEIDDHVLHRIRAVRDFTLNDGTEIKKGDLGGYIEKEDNLSHEWSCWVYANACVFGNARVFGDGMVSDAARVYDSARVHDNALVSGNAQVYGDARVLGNARVCGEARVSGNARVGGNAWVYDGAQVFGNVYVRDNAHIRSDHDYCAIQGFGSENRSTTFYNTSSEDGKYEVSVKCGCFEGTLAEFEAKVKETHGDNVHARTYLLAIEMVKIRFNINQ